MSVLETPRIFFKGEIAWDPIVTNNYDAYYDENAGETIFPAATDKVKAFRAEVISQASAMGNWNPHGTHRVTFYNSSVCGADLGDGVVTSDPFLAAAVQFTGMLVDLEPFGGVSSQLFFDNMRFGIDGGYRILAPRTSRGTARYINFSRNPNNAMIAGVASAVWQASFAKADGLRIDAFDSDALRSLAKALDADDVLGLTVRFNTYRTVYFDNPNLRNDSPLTPQAFQELTNKLQGGGFQPNPARSLLVGVIGLWRKGEPAHEPGDRMLRPAAGSPLASAHVRLGEKTMALDLSNSVRETSADKLQKQNLGVLTVFSVDPKSHASTKLGTFDFSQYDRAAYEASAGIVSISLASGAAGDGDIEVRNASGTALLTETPLRLVPNTPNLYLGEGETAKATFQLYDHGAPAARQVAVTAYLMSANGRTINDTAHMQTDAAGTLTIDVVATVDAIYAYVVSPEDVDPSPSSGINPQVYTYMYIRILPADANVGMMSPTWGNVYNNVLANWNAMAPCMDNWLMLDDPAQVRAQAAVLKRLTDPANFENFRFMPVTRDMTKGERELLYKFLDAPEDVLMAAAVAPAPHEDFAALSSALRRIDGG